jgi:hypothetical protein
MLSLAIALSLLVACGDDDGHEAEPSSTALQATATRTVGTTDTPVAVEPSATPAPAQPTSTPASPEEWMTIGGHLWIDARPAGAVISALIDGQICAEEWTLLPPVGPPVISLEVPPASERAGCGRPGATIFLGVNGKPAPYGVPWAGGETALVEVVIGPPFGRYGGSFTYEGAIAQYDVVPLIDGHVCGEQLPWPRGGPSPVVFYEIVVDPVELRPGCGRPGAIVELRVRITSPETGTHQASLGSVAWKTDGLVTLPPVAVAAP